MSKGLVTLAIIALAQLVAIFLIYNKIGAVERDIAVVMSTQRIGEYRNNPVKADTGTQSNHTYVRPTEDRMRQIIQEELRAELRNLSQTGQQVDLTVVTSSEDKAEMELRREQVAHQLEYFTSVGRITDLEMQKLQMDIAKLDAKGRSEALRELSRAINSGRLEGRL